MTYLLLLANAEGGATSAELIVRQLREFPGNVGLSVHFRPVRNDRLFESAKVAGQLAYRILAGEGVVRSQLWVEYEVLGPAINVTGRSSDLLFALALITSKWKKISGRYPAIAATGVLDLESAALSVEHTAAVQGVKSTAAKVAAAVHTLSNEPAAVIFYPSADAETVAHWRASAEIPAHVRLEPVSSLDDALAHLGITLEKVYLGNPFRGLEYFGYEHRSIFFGRDSEVRDVVEQLLRREAAGVPGLLVEGASGSGKSSFLRAGVLPALVNPSSQSTAVEASLRTRPIRDGVRTAIWRPGLLPTGAEESRIVESITDCWRTLPEFAARLQRECATLDELASLLRECWPRTQRFVWLIDQFEELFAIRLGDAEIDKLGQFLLKIQADGAWTLASIRADAVPQLKQHPALRQVFGSNEGQYYLERMSGTALDDVISRPAAAAGLTFGVGASGQRLDQVLREDAYRDRENALPLLQFTLRELYERRSGRELAFTAYEQLGGLSGSIATIAAGAVQAGDEGATRAATRIFRSLVSVDDEGRPSRRYAAVAEIVTEPAQRRLLDRLVTTRLCVTDQQAGVAVAAFAHEALLRTWPALVEWLKQEAGLLQARELAQHEARLWQEHGESDAWLAAADKSAAFKPLETAGIALAEPVRKFIERSERRVRRTTRIKQAVVALIALLAIVASGAGFVASRKQHEAESQAAQTLKAQSRLLIEAAAQRLKNSDVAGAQGIILEVLTNSKFAQSHTPEAIGVFLETRATDSQLAVLSGHSDYVTSAAYSPDGTRIVTASGDKTARIWDARTGAAVAVLFGHGDYVLHAAYSPDGTRIVTASGDKTARIWDAQTGAQLAVLYGHADVVHSAAYSPDGTRIVTASTDATARIWDARTGAALAVLSGHGDVVFSAAYSPDGTRIVTASADKTARIWDARTGAAHAVLSGHGDVVYSAAYSPDGTRIVTTSDDSTARIWDARTRVQLAVLSGHSSVVFSAAYSPDGTLIVTASADNTARIWDARTGAPLAVLQLAVVPGHGDNVVSAAYSPDGTRIVTASTDKTARIWDIRTGAPLAVLFGRDVGDVYSAAYSPDGTRIITASYDKTVRIWDARTGAQLAVLFRSSHGTVVFSAAYSPDGTRIVTPFYDKTAGVWDARSGAPLAVLSGHGELVFSAAYSPDGTRIVTASGDKTARIWDARTGAQLAVLSGHGDSVGSAAYSPDGTRIVTASGDKTARIWDARTGALLAVLSGHGSNLGCAAYSPDGTRIVTASGDKTARIWDARTGAALTVLSGHSGVIFSAAYSPDGTRIVTASGDKTARIWDARTGAPLAVLSGHAGAVVSAAYSPDGTRIVTASPDKTARIWDAGTGAPVGAQILWGEAAETDPLPDDDRTQLGLPPDARVRIWGSQGSACDQAAAAFYDPDRLTPGLAQVTIVADVATSACSPQNASSRNTPRLIYQAARALLAKSDVKGARQQFEFAVSEGYRAAQVDLANLLADPSAGMLDPDRAESLYQKAWQDGVPIAAFELGHLFEARGSGSNAAAPGKLHPDLATAWAWYKKGAEAGEPNALVRFAERDERNAQVETDPEKRAGLLLHAFSNYAAAAERAHDEDWPDEAWRRWRYRRATLARLLAREGMMQQVAVAYTAVLQGRSAHPESLNE